MAWGSNSSGQCDVPPPNSGFIAVAAGSFFSLALRSDGSIAAWGSNSHGQIDVPAPNAEFTSIAAGEIIGFGLKEDGSIVAWGTTSYGLTTPPEPNIGYRKITVGQYHAFAQKDDGDWVSWGWNSNGQIDIPGAPGDYELIVGGMYHSVGLRHDGVLVNWGDNNWGQLNLPSPNAGFMDVDAGLFHSAAVRTDGTAVAWGRDNYGQTGSPPVSGDYYGVTAGGYFNVVRTFVQDPAPVITAVADIPADDGGQVRVTWAPAYHDVQGSETTVTAYALWRLIDARGDGIRSVPEGIVLGDRSLPSGEWDGIGMIPAMGLASYGMVSPTLCDSTAAGDCPTTFVVTAHTPDPFMVFTSPAFSGSSVDNLAPQPPAGLMIDGALLTWLDSPERDLDHYAVYASETPEPDGTETHLGDTATTEFSVAGIGYRYLHVVAVDHAGNASDVATVADTSPVGEAPRTPRLLGAFPNPFNPRTSIRYGVDAAVSVDLSVYDASGRLVRVLESGAMRESGLHSVVWDGSDDNGRAVPAGLYVFRLDAGGTRRTGRAMLVK